MIWWANSIHSAFFVVRTSLQRFHTVLTNQHNQRTRDTYTLTRIRRCDCTNTTQTTLFFFERQQYPASANHEQSLFAMLLYPSTSLNLVYSWLVYLRSKLSKPSIFLKLFSLRRKLLWESCQNSRKSSKRSKLENREYFFRFAVLLSKKK